MTVTSSRSSVWFDFIVGILAAVLCAFLSSDLIPTALAEGDWAVLCISILLPSLVLLLCADELISTGRRLEMDAAGCTVSFGRLRRFYPWECFSVKRLEVYGFSLVRPAVYRSCILFSVHPKKRRIPPGRWTLLHPWTCFTIHEPQDRKKAGRARGYVPIYEVEMSVFKEKMLAWGVEIEGLTDSSA